MSEQEPRTRSDLLKDISLYSFRRGLVGTAPPLLERIIDDIANQFSGQNALNCRIFHRLSQNISRSDTPGPPQKRHRSAPGDWTQTPISAWLASVPIVPIFRNHFSKFFAFRWSVSCDQIVSPRPVLFCIHCIFTVQTWTERNSQTLFPPFVTFTTATCHT